MVFAEAEKFDIFDDDHFVVGHAEGGAIEDVFGVLQVAAGQKLQRFFEALGRFAQTFAIRILADQLDDFAHVVADAALVERFFLVQDDFFGRLGHCFYPSNPSAFSPAYSKLLLDVSCTRTRSSFAFGNGFNRRKISMQRFSVVGTMPRKAATSSLSDL